MNLKQAKRLRAQLGNWRTSESQRTTYRSFKARIKREGIIILRAHIDHPNYGGGVTTRSLLK